MDRILNYAFLILLIFLFVLDASGHERWLMGIGLVAGGAFSFLVFIFKWLTLDGAMAATVLGIVALGLGGWSIAALIILFFISSMLITRTSVVIIEQARQAYSEPKRRDGVQVWANGFWVAVWVVLAAIYNYNFLLLGAAGALATATADTWATEIGSRKFGGETYLITSFEPVDAGTDGGISLRGTVAAIFGSLMMGGASALLFPHWSWLILMVSIFLAGFLGCIADSYLGAALQQDGKTVSVGSEESLLQFTIDNNFVNWAATGFGSVAAVIINLFSL